jgi:hypothetical protein
MSAVDKVSKGQKALARVSTPGNPLHKETRPEAEGAQEKDEVIDVELIEICCASAFQSTAPSASGRDAVRSEMRPYPLLQIRNPQSAIHLFSP